MKPGAKTIWLLVAVWALNLNFVYSWKQENFEWRSYYNGSPAGSVVLICYGLSVLFRLMRRDGGFRVSPMAMVSRVVRERWGVLAGLIPLLFVKNWTWLVLEPSIEKSYTAGWGSAHSAWLFWSALFAGIVWFASQAQTSGEKRDRS